MAYDPGAIDATLAAALGDDPLLIAELRLAFVESAQRVLAILEAAGDDAEAWTAAAHRMQGLGASFGAERIMALAERAATTGPEPETLARMTRLIARL